MARFKVQLNWNEVEAESGPEAIEKAADGAAAPDTVWASTSTPPNPQAPSHPQTGEYL